MPGPLPRALKALIGALKLDIWVNPTLHHPLLHSNPQRDLRVSQARGEGSCDLPRIKGLFSVRGRIRNFLSPQSLWAPLFL